MDKEWKLGRTVNHDARSLAFGFDTTGLTIVDVEHKRLVPVFDQGQVASCTGNAGIGNINTEPFPLNSKIYSPDESGAISLYSDAEKLEGGAGYPPEDVGSNGLSIAKVLKNAGLISGYQHTFTLNDALKALTQYPIITGTNWYSGMFTPDPDGRVHPTGNLVGGHEYEAFKIDTENGRIWFYNSWGSNWGVNGTFYLSWADYYNLLSLSGDVTVLFPLSVPPPVPSVTLKRASDDGIQTLGDLTCGNFTCKTLERPWKLNANNISCIPTGIYTVKWTFSWRFLKYTYQLMNVPNRGGIRIHSANYFYELKGCIALGDSYMDLNKDGELDILNSRITVNKFNALMNKRDFLLIIS